MAPSLQGLIDFVLNEVALCGSQGAYSSIPDPLYSARGISSMAHAYPVGAPFHVNFVIAERPHQSFRF